MDYTCAPLPVARHKQQHVLLEAVEFPAVQICQPDRQTEDVNPTVDVNPKAVYSTFLC